MSRPQERFVTQLFTRNGTPATPNGKNAKGQPILSERQNCSRCGGLGGSDKWKHTGWTCYRCGGKCWDPNLAISILYTAEQNAKLDEAQRKREATRRKKAEIRAEIEMHRRNREREEMISLNLDLLERIDAELAHGEDEIMLSVATRIREHAKMPTERQIEVIEKTIARRSAERARLENVAHVGSIKERRDFTLTLLYTRSELRDQFPSIWSHWSLFLDENGRKIACKSAPWTLGLKKTYPEGRSSHEGYYEKGQTIRVKATVVEHTHDKKGEPMTYINRPKALEIAA
jgi:hypothetical protein